MSLFRTIFFAAVVSGLVAGTALTAIQFVKAIPLVLEAETYEGQAPASGAATRAARPEHAKEKPAAAHSGGEEGEWAPADGLERSLYTLLANVLIGIGFALLICAAFGLRGAPDWRGGLVFGLLGFAAIHLAPAFGLPPELPGMRAADVGMRQLWWGGTSLATAAGLALIWLNAKPVMKALGAILIVAPHVIGAPHPQIEGASALPAELAAAFVSATLVGNLLFWLLLGALSAVTFHKFKSDGAKL
jgi:cobalt transporter subunit CbtA